VAEHRVLLVEDEEELLFGLQDRLESEGYEVAGVRDGIEALQRAGSEAFHCIILDIGLPRKDGFEVCRELRQKHDGTPVLMLTARGEVAARVHGLRLGADDYLVKPFAIAELVARVEALIRRGGRAPHPPRHPLTEDLLLDLDRGFVCVRGVKVELSRMEMKLLHYFVEHRGTILSREELLAHVWGHATTLSTRTVDVHIATLRQKVEASPSQPKLIVTVHRGGYKLDG
jgi:DNA-binding response OmpR family regulator